MGFDTGAVTRDATRQTGFSYILNHGAERTPLFSIGANAAFCLEDIPRALIESSRCLLLFFAGILPSLDGAPLLELARRCRQADTAILVDVSDATDANYAGIELYMPCVNLVVNEEEGFRLTGRKGPEAILRALDAGSDAGAMFRGVTRRDGVTLSLPSRAAGNTWMCPRRAMAGRCATSSAPATPFAPAWPLISARIISTTRHGKLDYRAAEQFRRGGSLLPFKSHARYSPVHLDGCRGAARQLDIIVSDQSGDAHNPSLRSRARARNFIFFSFRA